MEIKKMQEEIKEELEKALKALDQKKYEDATNLISGAKMVSDDIIDTINEAAKKTRK
jgi:DNA-binding MurR/RpiR family transcriptional regulator